MGKIVISIIAALVLFSAPVIPLAHADVVCAAVMPECDEETKRPVGIDPDGPCYWYYAHQCLNAAYQALMQWCDACVQAGTDAKEECSKKKGNKKPKKKGAN